MSGGNGLDQLCFLTLADISFGNTPLFYGDIPERLKEFDDTIKIMEYNNQNKGIPQYPPKKNKVDFVLPSVCKYTHTGTAFL